MTFNQVPDIDFLVKNGYVSPDWQKSFPDNASPFYSLPSFLVRAGNPKNIKDWDDLARDDVQIIFPNPKTSGNARYTYLAAYAYGLEKFDGDTERCMNSSARYSRMCRCSTPVAAPRPPPSPNAASATC